MKKKSGVTKASVALATSTGKFEFDSNKIKSKEIVSAINVRGGGF